MSSNCVTACCLNDKHNVFFVAEKGLQKFCCFISNCDSIGNKIKTVVYVGVYSRDVVATSGQCKIFDCILPEMFEAVARNLLAYNNEVLQQTGQASLSSFFRLFLPDALVSSGM